MNIPRNVGGVDRLIRLVAAAVLGYLVYAGVLTGVWATVGLVFGVVLFITALVRYCPPYSLLGINTCKQ